jgi:signal transduction histidine kinase
MKDSTVLSLNRERTSDEAVPRPHQPENAAPEGNRVGVLLVDDDPRNLSVLESILDDPGYRLVRAESGDAALLELISGDFAVIVLDIHMPGLSGFELAQMIKQRRKTASIPIIFLTAHYNEDRHVLEGYQTGAVDYLLKPINPAIVRSKVAVFVELYRKTRESEAANAALTAEVAQRTLVEHEMRILQNDLERRVAERAAELMAANNALEQIHSELREADRRKDQFLAMLGHELRNPLSAICNAVVAMRHIGSPDKDLTFCRECIERQSELLTRLVDDLLDVSRVSQGKIQLENAPFDLVEAVRAAVDAAQPLVEGRRHQLTLTLPSMPLVINGDRMRMEQVVANLINNAVKYTDPGGRIEVSLVPDENGVPHAAIRVRDTGRGLGAAAIANLFDFFYQEDGNLDRSEGGLGVGLAIVRTLVELHGGTVEAQSPGRGHGSEFVVRVPCASPSAPTVHKPQDLGNAAAAGLRVLIVDDNVDAARSLAMMTRLLGHSAEVVHDGASAVEAALRLRPDVVLLDIGLPKLNGYEVCRALRQQGLHRELLVAVTGYGQDSDRQLSEDAGFDKHLVKPIGMPVIRELLAQYAAMRQCESVANQ